MALNVNRGDITAGYNFGVDQLNKLVRNTISAGNDFIEQILGMKIDERVDFNDLNYEFMKRLMAVNINERNVTMSHLGSDAHMSGDSTSITSQAQRPSYTYGMNYLEEFVSSAGMDEQNGLDTTRTTVLSDKHYKDPYTDVVNLYPDEKYAGEAGRPINRWRLKNDNSILYKTKQLFNTRKINTIISKFGTAVDDGQNLPGGLGDAQTEVAGMSHGRNLLQAAAEKKGISEEYDINGYNNPYCRVWTHHYQYDKLDKLIRPFVVHGSNGSSSTTSLKDLHTWGGFENNTNKKWDWKGGNTGWEKSVLDDNGFVKITPKYNGGGKNNTHTKDCMFSIENLAWKGYDPYSFEQALSWEQRGPFGGRIMWFPPYGLSFNETTQTNWSSNTFIGRGEDVYTYVNTVRSGTLSFIMLTDHPSVIDYANWYDGRGGSEDLTDTDILRFFAGCDSGDSNDEYSIMSKVKPTPLTDEYIKNNSDKNKKIEPLPKSPQEPEKKQIPEKVKEIQFNVFFPNNYSGVYDMPSPNAVSSVHAIAYLLKGKGSQKESDGQNDIPLSFNELASDISSGHSGTGYEMSGSGISSSAGQGNYILGSKLRWDAYKGNPKTYIPEEKRKYFYRVDGEYKVPSGENGKITNTYDQILHDASGKPAFNGGVNYSDSQGFSLNKDAEAVKSSGFVGENTENLYSLLEFAAAAAKHSNKTATYNALITEVSDGSRVDEIVDTLDKYEIESISISGYSNSHGTNSSEKVNKSRNNHLSTQRADTIRNWLKECSIISDKTPEPSGDSSGGNHSGESVGKGDEFNVNAKSAKLYRSTKVVIRFKMSETETLSEAAEEHEKDTTIVNGTNKLKFIGVNIETGFEQYQDEDGVRWYKDSDGLLKKIESNASGGSISNERFTMELTDEHNNDGRRLLFFQGNGNADDSMNTVRYDQEYYFYKKLEKDNPIVFKKLTEKLKYFDPAFHSMTPEGFTERLTFLNQCTRQGNTITPSDTNAKVKTANNLGFGRPPFCVLRIGDFYYQTIIIESINIDYNVSGGLQWDLNPEGNGVQPMLAQININFKFIGGGDLGGPIRRLQNAMTFNYYANSRLHDNRADRIEYNWSDKSNGALDHDVNTEGSYAYTAQMAK